MGLFDFFARRPTLEEGLEGWKETPDALVVDLRTPQEYRAGHVPGAKNLPLDRLGGVNLPKSQPVFAYCLSGARSAQACAWLKRKGYEATNLGGIGGYRGPLET